jgi:hypothetical protein
MSFATGFFSAMARDLESRGEYIREQRAKRKDYLMTYGTRAVVEREELANKAISVGRMLEAKGFDAEDINYIVGQAGPNALGLIYEEIKDIPKERLTKEVIDPIIKLPETYKPAGMSYEEAVRKAFGLYKGTATDDPAENQQRGLFSGMLFNPDAANSVLDEEYISGFTGRDIYRIMGTPTPGLTGAPDLDFSTLPATYSIGERRELVRSVKDHMLGQASKKVSSVSSDDYTKMSPVQKQEFDLLKAAVNNENYGVILEKMPELKTYILDFDRETRGGLRYNSVFSSDPAFKGVFDEAVRQVEVADTGATGITPEKDSTLAPSDVLGYTQMRDSVNVSVPAVNELPVFSSEREARESGETFFIVERNGKMVAGSNLPTDTTPKTDLGDMTGAPGFRDMIEPNPELTTEERVKAKKDATQGVIDAVDGSVASFTKTLDKGFASGALTANAYGNTLLGGVAQIVGADGAADFFYTQAVKSEDGVDSTEGLVPAINSILDKLGVPDYSKDDEVLVDLQSAVDVVMSAIPAIPKEDSSGRDLDAAIDRAPDHIKKLGDQAMDAWRKLTAEVKDFSFSDISLSTPDEDNPMLTLVEELVGEQTTEVSEEKKPANVATRASDTPAYKQLQELLQERIALANRPPKDKKKKEATIKKKAEKILIDLGDMSGAPGFRTEEVSLLSLILADELPERIVEYNPPVEYNPRTVGTVGFQDLGLRHTTDDVRERQNQPPDLQMSAARGPSPTEDSRVFDKPKNMAVEGLLTRRSRGNPNKPVSPTMDKDPDVGGMGIATLAKRVHGGKAKAVATFEKKLSSGKVTAADVARMIKATDKLPETANKVKLLVMLYDLRDSINKR